MAILKTDTVIDAIYEMHGNLTAVARKFRTTRNRMYRFVDKHPSVKDALEESRERMLDNAESVLYRKVLSGEDTTALIFFLKTQGARRGYTERQHVTMDVNIRREAERLAQEYGLDVDEVMAEAERIVKAQ